MRIKIRDIVFAALFCLIAIVALADSVAPNKKWKTSSADGKYFIEMIPRSDYGEEGEGIVTHYSSGKILWKIGWFARLVALSNDGVHLVRFGPWAGDKKRLSDLAISFYEKDKLLKEYLVRDLVRDRTKLEETKSHYFWQANKSSIAQGFSADNKTFTVVTLDGIAYIFNVSKGFIIKQNQDPKVEGYLQ
jgi:hypothetical protein